MFTKKDNHLYTFSITFRDTEHFYRVVAWLNHNIGHGKQNWTMDGRVLRKIKRRGECTTVVVIKSKNFNDSDALYLSLI
jgi:hypothetical protein